MHFKDQTDLLLFMSNALVYFATDYVIIFGVSDCLLICAYSKNSSDDRTVI